VWDEALSQRARRHLEALGLADLVRFHVGESVEALAGTRETVDLVFNDIDKAAYPASLDVIGPRLRSGGVLIVDNVLWSGRIFDASDTTAATTGVRELTRRLTSSPDWTTSIVPIRDGLIVARRT
jgi:predicted O-methyltransferase YrrM